MVVLPPPPPPILLLVLLQSVFWTELEETASPEILRTSLCSTVLCLKSFGIRDVLGFDFLQRPPQDALVAALEELLALQALDRSGAKYKV